MKQEKTKKKEKQIQKFISSRYGEHGLRVYELIDGKTPATEILTKAKVSESELVDILDFLDEHGIIRLNFPTR